MLVDQAGRPLTTQAESPIVHGNTAALPDWPLSGALTFTNSNYTDHYNTNGQPWSIYWMESQPGEDYDFLRMTMPSESDQGGSGYVRGRMFGPQQDKFSFIFEYKVDSEYIYMTSYQAGGGSGGIGSKLAIAYDWALGSCSNEEITCQNQYPNNPWRNGPQWYIRCGSPGLVFTRESSPDYTDFQFSGNDLAGGYAGIGECSMWYEDRVPPEYQPPLPKFLFQDGIWTTYLCVTTGLGTNDTITRVYCYCYGGDPQWANRWVCILDYHYQRYLSNGTAPDKAPTLMDSLQITSYATGKDASIVHTPYNLDLRKGYQCGPYDYTPIMALGEWQGPNVPDQRFGT